MRLLFLTSILIFSSALKAKIYNPKRVNYKTVIGSCPSKTAGEFSLLVMKEFDKKKSLLSVKELIVKEKLDTKYYLSSFNIELEPFQNQIKLTLDCPEPIMKVQITRENGDEFYTAILGNNGKLLDPNYEVVLRAEKKLKASLPSLVLPVTFVENKKVLDFISLMNSMTKSSKEEISEMVVNNDEELTIILSVAGRTSTVFLGKNYWEEKTQKLTKVVEYMKSKNKIPSIINLTNLKKIVVKF